MRDVEPYDLTPDILRAMADVVEHLQKHEVSVWRVEYDAHPQEPLREPVYLEAVTDYHGDRMDPTGTKDDFPADLEAESDFADIDIYVESAPTIDFLGPRAAAIWDLAVVVSNVGRDEDAG